MRIRNQLALKPVNVKGMGKPTLGPSPISPSTIPRALAQTRQTAYLSGPPRAPTTKEGIEEYLGSGMVKGIGLIYA
jgi:hypothetical protein